MPIDYRQQNIKLHTMKESDLEALPTDKIEVSVRNRIRLTLQNKKLLSEVYKLQQIINTVIQKTATDEFTSLEESQQLRQKYKQQQEEQMRTIVKLKKDIKAMKTNIAQHKYEEIRDEENQVTYLKRQLNKLINQRDTLAKKKQQKDQGLQFHKPINNLTASTLEQYKKAKASNNELKQTIHEVEREVAKYHNMKQLSKTSVPKKYDNPDYQYIKIENEMNGMKKQMKRIDQKWRAKIEALDKEYFSFKEIKKYKTAEIDNLQKEAKNYQNHIAAMRDEVAIASDRERLNKVTISPQKRKEMQDLLQDEKKRLKRLSPKSIKAKNEKLNKNAEINKKDKQQLKLIPQVKEQAVQEARQVPTQVGTQYSEKKVQQKKEQKSLIEEKKATKMVESVGVGTSFYYTD